MNLSVFVVVSNVTLSNIPSFTNDVVSIVEITAPFLPLSESVLPSALRSILNVVFKPDTSCERTLSEPLITSETVEVLPTVLTFTAFEPTTVLALRFSIFSLIVVNSLTVLELKVTTEPLNVLTLPLIEFSAAVARVISLLTFSVNSEIVWSVVEVYPVNILSSLSSLSIRLVLSSVIAFVYWLITSVIAACLSDFSLVICVWRSDSTFVALVTSLLIAVWSSVSLPVARVVSAAILPSSVVSAFCLANSSVWILVSSSFSLAIARSFSVWILLLSSVSLSVARVVSASILLSSLVTWLSTFCDKLFKEVLIKFSASVARVVSVSILVLSSFSLFVARVVSVSILVLSSFSLFVARVVSVSILVLSCASAAIARSFSVLTALFIALSIPLSLTPFELTVRYSSELGSIKT